MTTDPRVLAFQQVAQLAQHQRIIVLHPDFEHQRVVFQHFLQGEATVYMRLTQPRMTYTQMQVLFDVELDAQMVCEVDAPARLRTLLVDECDRADASALHTWLTEMLQAYPDLRVVLAGRDLPFSLLNSEYLRAHTAIIPRDDRLMLRDYTRPGGAGHLLEVRALGAGQVVVNGRSVASWDGVLPRALFFYLVDRGMATRSDIFATFWPKLTTREATNVFHVTKRKINEILGIDLTVYWSGYYRLSPDITLSYDTILFSELAQQGEITQGDEAEALLERALVLYRGAYLSTLDTDWVRRRRSELAQMHAEVLSLLGTLKEQRGDLQGALNCYIRAVRYSGEQADLLAGISRLAMQLYGPGNDPVQFTEQGGATLPVMLSASAQFNSAR